MNSLKFIQDAERTSRKTNCVFEQPWFLDAVAPGHWEEVTVTRNGRVVARLPFQKITTRLGFVCLSNPPLCQTIGPWIDEEYREQAGQLGRNHEILEELIRLLPTADKVDLCLHSTVRNILPFHWAGFDVRVKCTYRIPDITNREKVFDGFTGKCRNTVRKAEKLVEVREGGSDSVVWHLIEKTWNRQGLKTSLSSATVKRLTTTARDKQAGKLWLAVGADAQPHAFGFFVWDEDAVYYLLGGSDSKLRSSGAQNLIIWKAMQWFSDKTKVFDFEGSMLRNIESWCRSFGAEQTAYYRVSRESNRFRRYLKWRNLLAPS